MQVPWPKYNFIDTGDIHFMPKSEKHVSCINEVYLDPKPYLINPGENPES